MDLRNALSLAAILKAHCTDPKCRGEVIFNTDSTTLWLQSKRDPVWATPGIEMELKKHGRGISRVKDERGGQSIALIPTVTASGELLCVVVAIKNEEYHRPALYQVRIIL